MNIVQWFSRCYMQTDRQTDRHGEDNRRIFATLRSERAKKHRPILTVKNDVIERGKGFGLLQVMS